MKKEFSVVGLTTSTMVEAFRSMLPLEFDQNGEQGNYLLGAFDEAGTPCGVCWYQFTGLYYELLFLGVHPAFRGQGVGTLLLGRMLRSLYEMNMVFPVRLSFVCDDQLKPFRRFLIAQGNFFFSAPDRLFSVSPENRAESELWQKFGKNQSDAIRFFELPGNVRNEFMNRQHELGLLFLQKSDINGEGYAKDLSFCTLRGKRIETVLLIKQHGENAHEATYLYNESRQPKQLMHVLSAAIRAIDVTCPETILQIKVVNQKSEKLVHHLFPQLREYMTIENAVWDFSVR